MNGNSFRAISSDNDELAGQSANLVMIRVNWRPPQGSAIRKLEESRAI
jgi:hypothetical protein